MKIIVAIHIITFLSTTVNTQEKRNDDYSDQDDQFSESSDKFTGVSSTPHVTATPDVMHGFKSVVIHKEENISGGLTVQEPPKGWPFSEMTIQFPSNPKEVKVVKKQFKGDSEKILSSPGTIYSVSKHTDKNVKNLHSNTQTVNPFSQVLPHPSPTPTSFVNYPYVNRTVGTNEIVENTDFREPKSRQDFNSPSSVNLGYSIGFGSIPSALMPSTQMLQLINNLPTETIVLNSNNNAGNALSTSNNEEEQLPQAAALRQEKPKSTVSSTFSTPVHNSHTGVTGRFRNNNHVGREQTKHSTQQQNWITNNLSNHRFQTSTNNDDIENSSSSTNTDTIHDNSAQNSNGLSNFQQSFTVQSKPISFDTGHTWRQLGNGVEISNSASTQHAVIQENVQNNQNQAEIKTQPVIHNLVTQDHALFFANSLGQINQDSSLKSTQGVSAFDHDNALGHSSLFSYNDAITGSPVALAQTQDAQNIANNILQAYTLNTKPIPTPPVTHTSNTNEVQTSQSQKQPVRHQFTNVFSINKQTNRNSSPTSQQGSSNNVGISSVNGNSLQSAVNHNNGGGLTANSHQLINLNNLNHAIQSPIIMNPGLFNFGSPQPLHLGNSINSVQMPSLFIPLSSLQNIPGGQSLVFGTPIQGNTNQIHNIPSQSASVITGTPHVMQILPAKQANIGATVIGHGLASAPVLPQIINHQNYFNSVQADSGKQKQKQAPHVIKVEKFNSTPVNIQGTNGPGFLQLQQVANNNGAITSQGISSHGGQFLHNFNSNLLPQNGNVVGISSINQQNTNFNQGAPLQAAHSIQGATALPLRSSSPIIAQGTNIVQNSGNQVNLANPTTNSQNHQIPVTNFQGFVPVNNLNAQIPQLIQGNSIFHNGQNNNVFTLNSANGIKSDFSSKLIGLPGNLQKATTGITYLNKGTSNNGFTPGRGIPIAYNGLNAQLLGGTFHFGRGLHLHKGNNKANAVKQQTQFSPSEQIHNSQNVQNDQDILTSQSGNPFQNHLLLNNNIKGLNSANDNQHSHIVSGNTNTQGTQTKPHTFQGVNDQLTPQQQHEIRLQHNTDKLRQQQALSSNVNGHSNSQVTDQTFASSNIQTSQAKNIPKSRSDKTRRNQDILRKPNISVTVHDLVKPVMENPENLKPVSYLNSAVPTYVMGLRPPSIHLTPMPLLTIA